MSGSSRWKTESNLRRVLRFLTNNLPKQADRAASPLQKLEDGKKAALTALDLYVENKIDWSDAFIASQMLAGQIKEIISFNQRFDKIKGITRIEP